MAYEKPKDPKPPDLPKDGKTAQGLNASAMAGKIISNLAGVSITKFLEKDKNGNEFMSKENADKMKEEARQKLCDAINEEIEKNCYLDGDYVGLLNAGSPPPPDLNGPFTFEVEKCNVTPADIDFYATDHSGAITSFQSKLALGIRLKLFFKAEDTRKYLTIPPLQILPGTLNINIEKNTGGENIDQSKMMERIVKEVISGIQNAKVPPSSAATSKGPGTGTWTFKKIN